MESSLLDFLNRNAERLSSAELDYFENKIRLGSYPPETKTACMERIQQLRAEKREKASLPKQQTGKDAPAKPVVHPAGEPGPALSPEKRQQKVTSDMNALRTAKNYKTAFRNYVTECGLIDEAFIDGHFSFFTEDEIGTLLTFFPFGENFLSRYFETLDKGKIARYQLFSEDFFMNHFNELDPQIVLKRGVNPWREKGNRSSRLDVFLRLKGINL